MNEVEVNQYSNTVKLFKFDFITGKVINYVRYVTFANHYHIYEFVCYLLFVYNLRISEVLRIKPSDIIQDKCLRIKLSKSKEFLLIRDNFVLTSLNNLRAYGESSLFNLNYMQVYRYITSYRPEFIQKFNQKYRSVTHTPRYTNVRLVNDVYQDELTNKAVLNHRSVKSQTYYLKGTKQHG